jgi:hypothetical protein
MVEIDMEVVLAFLCGIAFGVAIAVAILTGGWR